MLAFCIACHCAMQKARLKSDGYTCRTARKRLADGGSNPPSSTIPTDKGLQVAILGALFLWKINGVQDSSVQRRYCQSIPIRGYKQGANGDLAGRIGAVPPKAARTLTRKHSSILINAQFLTFASSLPYRKKAAVRKHSSPLIRYGLN